MYLLEQKESLEQFARQITNRLLSFSLFAERQQKERRQPRIHPIAMEQQWLFSRKVSIFEADFGA